MYVINGQRSELKKACIAHVLKDSIVWFKSMFIVRPFILCCFPCHKIDGYMYKSVNSSPIKSLNTSEDILLYVEVFDIFPTTNRCKHRRL